MTDRTVSDRTVSDRTVGDTGGPGAEAAVPDDSIRYVDAMAELEAILAELEGDDVDVDVLAARVARAAELIRLCRGRLSDARVRVEQVVADLDAVERG